MCLKRIYSFPFILLELIYYIYTIYFNNIKRKYIYFNFNRQKIKIKFLNLDIILINLKNMINTLPQFKNINFNFKY